ncbi:Dps family protein [Rapidithrix thailandica]|uniref:Dps family protein n=1 Tax=Rapidithrix thailandica TaxID=413964 RepID=A0AAW9S379_9BACT
MSTLNFIGLDKAKSEKLANKLNQLLANFQVYYQNLRGFHWNIQGQNFFELHAKFEEQYTDAQQKIDDIAERILTLGSTPFHSFSTYLESTQIKESKNISDGLQAVQLTTDNIKSLLTIEREALAIASELDDEGSVTLLSDFISEQEKTVWMFTAWLGQK